MPFSLAVVWSLMRIRLPVARVTPSMVWPFAYAVASVPFVVVATRTGCFQDRPRTALSTYCLVARSVGEDGSAALTARWDCRSMPLENLRAIYPTSAFPEVGCAKTIVQVFGSDWSTSVVISSPVSRTTVTCASRPRLC
jgi:hypothetical protein